MARAFEHQTHQFKPVHVTCQHVGCDKPAKSRYCAMHEKRLSRTGRLDRLPIQLTNLASMSPLGLNITALRFYAEMSVDQLAHAAGTSKWTVWNICRGGSCTLDLLWKICAALNVEAWRLMKPGEFDLPNWFVEKCR